MKTFQAKALALLVELYRSTLGNTNTIVDVLPLERKLGLDTTAGAQACVYLAYQGMVRQLADGMVVLTDKATTLLGSAACSPPTPRSLPQV